MLTHRLAFTVLVGACGITLGNATVDDLRKTLARMGAQLVMVGDSTMGMQRTFLQRHGMNSSQMTMFPNAGGVCPSCDFPSLPEKSACAFVNKTLEKRKFSRVIVYINLGALHLLHLHPYRKFAYSPGHGSWKADFWGLLFLETWMKSEIDCLSALAALVIVMLPHHICESCYHGKYKTAVEDPENTITGCARQIANDTAITLPGANGICRASMFTGSGTDDLARRMSNVVHSHFSCAHASKRTPVCILDANHLTQEMTHSCEYTTDGRHYNESVIGMEVEALGSIITKLHPE